MQQDVVDQVPREGHQQEGEVDVLPAAATAPTTGHILDGYPFVMKAMLESKGRYPYG